jgi:p-cumate 2,3-dioxygenase subunit beta
MTGESTPLTGFGSWPSGTTRQQGGIVSVPTIKQATGPVTDPVLLCGLEQFLYAEAALLDSWQLDEWLTLMHPSARYRVPAPGWEKGSAALTLQLINDDLKLLRGRVARLKSKHAHAESPKSHTRRLISNVRAYYGVREEGPVLVVHSNFHVLRNRLGKLDHFVGSYRHTLLVPAEATPPGYLILERLTMLDHDLVEAGGTVSILL